MGVETNMDTNAIITELRDWAEVQGAGTLSNILNKAADRLEELDERVAIMSVERSVSRVTDREKVIKGLHQHCEGSMFDRCGECPYYEYSSEPFQCRDLLLLDAFELLKEQEGYVSVPFSWLVKFCTHIDFNEPMSNKEREMRWKEKLSQQFGVKWDEL